MSYHQEARAYIEKLIRLQRGIRRKGFTRIDQPAVSSAMEDVRRQLAFYRYDSDEKMRGFWRRYRTRIRTLIPTRGYSGYEKLMKEFQNLDE